ncbi:hypothetical protein K3495_g16172 [Podosphaera aphanis]|nr:hypothetical protein K3495_g16172 [Podosphaera aphanis]
MLDRHYTFDLIQLPVYIGRWDERYSNKNVGMSHLNQETSELVRLIQEAARYHIRQANIEKTAIPTTPRTLWTAF